MLRVYWVCSTIFSSLTFFINLFYYTNGFFFFFIPIYNLSLDDKIKTFKKSLSQALVILCVVQVIVFMQVVLIMTKRMQCGHEKHQSRKKLKFPKIKTRKVPVFKVNIVKFKDQHQRKWSLWKININSYNFLYVNCFPLSVTKICWMLNLVSMFLIKTQYMVAHDFYKWLYFNEFCKIVEGSD